MIIDCHGHYTTTPPGVGAYREAQKEAVGKEPSFRGEKGSIDITDDEIRESIEKNQLRLQEERGTDLTIFSPRASWMGHHIGNEWTSLYWTEHQNDIIRRVCDLFPKNFAPVAQLPQSPRNPWDESYFCCTLQFGRKECVERGSKSAEGSLKSVTAYIGFRPTMALETLLQQQQHLSDGSTQGFSHVFDQAAPETG